MKKFLSISLAIYFLSLSIGVSVNVHYCGGKVAFMELFSFDSSCCSTDDTFDDNKSCSKDDTSDKGCCNKDVNCCFEESFVFKLNTEDIILLSYDSEKKQNISTDQFSSTFKLTVVDQKYLVDKPNYLQDKTGERPAYLLYSSFLFYG